MIANSHIKSLLFFIMVSCCISSESFAQKAVLKHSYTFNDGTPADVVGNANGLLKGGKIKDGKYFTTADGQYIELPGKTINLKSYTSLSLEVYIIAGEGNAENTTLSYFGNKNGTLGTDYIMLSPKNKGYTRSVISCKNKSTPWTTSTITRCNTLEDGHPHHIVVTFDNKVLKLYVDGLLVSTQTNEEFPDNLLENIGDDLAYLAKSGYRSDPTWLGVIDAFNIYEGILDAETIEKSAQEYVPRQVLAVRSNLNNLVSSEKFVASESLFNDNGIIHLAYRTNWRFHPGDDMTWANPDFDDSNWISFMPAGLTEPIPDSLWNGYGWFRFRFAADSSVYSKVTNLYFSTYGAAEVYLDGKLVQKYGVFSTDAQEEKYYNPYYKLHPAMVLQQAGSHVLAVRFSYHKGQQYKKLLGKYARTFGFSTGLATDDLNKRIFSSVIFARQYFFTLGTILLLIVFLHGFFFLLLPAERSNFYIAIVAFLLLLHISVTNPAVFVELDVLQFMLFKQIPYIVIFLAAVSMFPLTINSMFNHKPRLMHRMLICSFPFVALANFIFSGPDINVIVGVVYGLVILFFSSQVLIQAWRNKQKGVLFVAGGFLGLIAITIAWIIYSRFSQNYSGSIANGLAYSIYIT